MLPQGDPRQSAPLDNPSGSLHFYKEIRGFFELPDFDGVNSTGRVRHPLPPQMAQNHAPQMSPMLGNATKYGNFVISHWRKVLA